MVVYDFAFYLTLAVVITGLIVLVDKLFLVKKRRQQQGKQPLIIEYARAFFPVLLIVWVIRSFLIQPYRVPTGSLVPTVMPGDFIAVNQFDYGIRLPVTNTKIINIHEPQRGQIALFRYPVDPSIIFVKRVIGLPGDHVVYKNKQLSINGKPMPMKFLGTTQYTDESGQVHKVDRYLENLDGVKHEIILDPKAVGDYGTYHNVVVPEGHYFMLGDNRDNSDDSRVWGLVPEENLIGKAFGIWMSWNSHAEKWKDKVRWQRIGLAVK